MIYKKILVIFMFISILSCEYRSPDPQEVFSFSLKIEDITEFESVISDLMESQKYHKDTALSDSKLYEKLTKNNKGIILFEDNKKSYVMFNNLLHVSCFNISIYKVSGKNEALKQSTELKKQLTQRFGKLNLFKNHGCK